MPASRRRSGGAALAFALALLAVLLLPALASAAPFWRVSGHSTPTRLAPGGKGVVKVNLANLGTSATNGSAVTVVDHLPPGVIATDAGEEANGNEEIGHLDWDCSGIGTENISCVNDPVGMPTIAPGPGEFSANTSEQPGAPALFIAVSASAGAGGEAQNEISVAGGGAPSQATFAFPIPIDNQVSDFGFADSDLFPVEPASPSAIQAGAHPGTLVTSFDLNENVVIGTFEQAIPAGGDVRNVDALLPPGVIGNPGAVFRCPRASFDEGEDGNCPASAQIGTITVKLSAFPLVLPLFNLVPPPGVPAQFGFRIFGNNTFIDASVRSGGDYGITEHVTNITQRLIIGSVVRIWGVPADHNGSGEPRVPFLSNPTSCPASQALVFHASSWLNPGTTVGSTAIVHDGLGEPLPITGCNTLDFSPSVEARSTTNVADAAAGFNFDFHIPQNEDPDGLAEAELKDATVTLPKGVTVNPASANGLAACSSEQIALHSAAPPTCPDASKLGTVEVETPLIDHPLPGAVYLAAQGDNPFGSLLAVYVVIDDPVSGVVVKLPGHVEADPVTGQLTTRVAENPQLPFEDLKLDFFGGAHSPLKTPTTCGTFTTTTDLTPWTSPEGEDAGPSDSFEISKAAAGGPCAASEAALPNKPAFTAGTISPVAGAYSPFVLKLSREDGSQQLSRIDTTLPEGLLGKLAGIPYCSDAQIAAATARGNLGEGVREQNSPSCPMASQIGSIDVGTGAGPTPYYVSGKVYLAGPYRGAPLSMAVITPGVAGPFDLGTVVVRVALHVEPETAKIHAVSDPFPSILHGIPLDLRSVALKVDRPDFTLNPTSCEKKEVTGTLASTLGLETGLSSPFQVGGCGNLGFKPKLGLKLSGGTKRSDFPALTATLSYPQGSYANIASASVALPHTEFLAQGHINTVCTRVQFAADACPKGAVYGFARAISPLLEKPLEGPVYLGTGYGHKLPDLVVDLKGQIDVVLRGRIDTDRHDGIRTTFESVPDAPVSKFTLSMKGGGKGLLENSGSICRKPERATVKFDAQNGRISDLTPLVANDCHAKTKKHSAHGRH